MNKEPTLTNIFSSNMLVIKLLVDISLKKHDTNNNDNNDDDGNNNNNQPGQWFTR